MTARIGFYLFFASCPWRCSPCLADFLNQYLQKNNPNQMPQCFLRKAFDDFKIYSKDWLNITKSRRNLSAHLLKKKACHQHNYTNSRTIVKTRNHHKHECEKKITRWRHGHKAQESFEQGRHLDTATSVMQKGPMGVYKFLKWGSNLDWLLINKCLALNNFCTICVIC